MREEEFWNLSPQEFNALYKRWERAEEVLDHRTGIIAAIFSNAHFKGKFKPEDFMPKKGKGKKQAVKDMIAIAESMSGKKADTGKK